MSNLDITSGVSSLCLVFSVIAVVVEFRSAYKRKHIKPEDPNLPDKSFPKISRIGNLRCFLSMRGKHTSKRRVGYLGKIVIESVSNEQLIEELARRQRQVRLKDKSIEQLDIKSAAHSLKGINDKTQIYSRARRKIHLENTRNQGVNG